MLSIYVARDGKQLGPFTPAEVRSQLAQGSIASGDLGWREGMPDWRPLAEVMGALEQDSRWAPPKTSSFTDDAQAAASSSAAWTSFLIGILGIPAWIAVLAVAAIGANRGAGANNDPLLIISGLCIFAGVPLNLLGAILGGVKVASTISNKWMAIVGMILNLAEIAAILGLTIVGMTIAK
ncbi:MAG TPA: DUF4339 domain-containing protein [Pirellulales bacterium]|jgi:hypothetical protein|nr:DUF4339 domain-containing protein [Pirellulales bacterium]